MAVLRTEKRIFPINDLYAIVTEIGDLPEELNENKINTFYFEGKVFVMCCVEEVVLAYLEGQDTVEVNHKILDEATKRKFMEDKPKDVKVIDLVPEVDFPEVLTVEDLIDDELTEEDFAEEFAEEDEEIE